MSVVVRPMTDDDDLEALNADNPEAWASIWLRDVDRDEDPHWVHWFVGELDGEPVGVGFALRQAAASGGYGVGGVQVLERFRRRGVGTALLGAVEASLREAGLPGMLLAWKEGNADGEAAANAWGLRETDRHRDNELDLTAIDRVVFAARAATPGVALRLLPPLDEVTDARWVELYAFYAARVVEAPDLTDGGEAPPFVVFRAVVTDPWSIVLAEEEGRTIGLTVAGRRPGSADVANTFFTGTVPDARGRGIATALKCRQALLMADAGVTRFVTQNMDGNDAMLAVNRTLGFVASGGTVDVVRAF